MNNTKIYFISGKARHGKDTIGNYLKEFYESDGYKVITCSYASYLKDYAMKISNSSFDDNTKPRELLQRLGSLIRVDLGKSNMLIDRLNDDILIYSNFFDAIIITDVRLKIEINGIKDKYPSAVSIHVNRPNFDNGLTASQKMDMTEIDLDDYDDYDYNIENTTLDNLKSQVYDIYVEER